MSRNTAGDIHRQTLTDTPMPVLHKHLYMPGLLHRAVYSPEKHSLMVQWGSHLVQAVDPHHGVGSEVSLWVLQERMHCRKPSKTQLVSP